MVKIGNCTLGKEPKIVAIIDSIIEIEKLIEIAKNADIFEIRVDCLKKNIEDVVKYVSLVKEKIDIPMIGTIRENDFTKDKRIDFFKAIIPFVDSIDIEIDSNLQKDIIRLAQGKTIIVSEHNFELTPDEEGIKNIVNRALLQGADIVKVAFMAKNREDVIRLLMFTYRSNIPMVSIAMGDIGKISRVFAPFFGSLYTYGYITSPVAPGQLSVWELAEEFKRYFGWVKR